MTDRKIRALLIEDSAEDADLIRGILDDYPSARIDLTTVPNLHEGYRRLEREDFDVIVLDLNLPDSSGAQTIQNVTAKVPRLPVIVLTGHGDEESGFEGIRLGVQDFLDKGNIGGSTLPRSIRYAVERKNLENVIAEQRDLLDDNVKARTREIAASNARLEHLLHSSPAVLFSFTLRGDPQIDYVSENVRDIFGFEAMDFIGRIDRWIEYFHPEDRPKIEVDLDRLLQGKTPTIDYRLRARGGDYRWVHGFIRVFADAEGHPSEAVGYVVDVTSQKEAEAERSRLVTAIEQARDVIVVTDAKGNILYANPAFEQATGYFREQVAGKNTRFLKSGKHEPSFYDDLWGTVNAGEVWKGRFFNKRKDGTIYPEDATISPVRNESGQITHFVKVAQDVTEKMNLEKQLLQSQRMEAVGQLAGGVAHDFNNLLQVITGYAQMELERTGIGETERDSLKQIKSAADKASTLTRQLLAFGRRQILQPVNLDLNNVISDVMKMTKRLIGEHIRLEVKPGPGLRPVHADPGQIEQIVLNLAVNARDAMPEGGTITLQTENVTLDESFRAAHPWANQGDYALLTFSDTGAGMSEEVRDRIFEPFFTTKEQGKGTGLGLATVYGIVKQHNGLIHVYSELGRGTIFKIYLPAAAGEKSELQRKSQSPSRGGDETILVAEDETNVRELVKTILERAGYQVRIALDGADAVRQFETSKEEIDLAMLDLVMPNLGGKNACEAMLELKPDLRFLFCSGYSPDAFGSSFLADARFEFVAKPFSPDELLRKVRAVLDKPGVT